MDDGVMRARVGEARVGRLGTVTVEGRPHLAPCCFALDGQVVYSAVDGKPKSTLALRRLDNLRANPVHSRDWRRRRRAVTVRQPMRRRAQR